jgi:hypothetical protein
MKNIDYANQARKSLLIYAATLSGLMVAVCAAMAANGHHLYTIETVSVENDTIYGEFIFTLPLALFVGVFLYYVYYNLTSKKLLSRVRYGLLVAHVTSFLIVNVPFHLYAFILFMSNNAAIRGNDNFAISPDWYGVLFGMTTFWAIGLLVHTIASVANRGFEELPRG